MMCFLGLLLLHSYMTLEAFSDTVQPYEIILAVWMGTVALDEIAQVRWREMSGGMGMTSHAHISLLVLSYPFPFKGSAASLSGDRCGSSASQCGRWTGGTVWTFASCFSIFPALASEQAALLAWRARLSPRMCSRPTPPCSWPVCCATTRPFPSSGPRCCMQHVLFCWWDCLAVNSLTQAL